MRAMKFCCVAAILVAVVSFAAAQDQKTPAEKPTVAVKHVPITQTSATSGKEMFINYCAVCHGKDGKGNGPAASALKMPPPDLTTLAAKSGGKYPSAHVASVIRGQAKCPRTAARTCRFGVRCSPASARDTKRSAAEGRQPGRIY